MKSVSLLAPLAIASSMACLAAAAAAQPYASRYESVTYGYASVLRVTPAYDAYRTADQQPPCDDGGYQPTGSGDTIAETVLGAIVGGALGNTVGKGDGRKATTIAGAVAGGVIGHNIARNNDSNRSQQGPCRLAEVGHDERHVVGYDVEYNYKGEVYVARMSYDPGNRIRVRVTVLPADGDMPPPRRR